MAVADSRRKRLDRSCFVDNKPRYLFGDTITYADCALFHVLDAAMSQFPDAWDEPPSCESPRGRRAVHEATMHVTLGAYLKADDRAPWAGDSIVVGPRRRRRRTRRRRRRARGPRPGAPIQGARTATTRIRLKAPAATASASARTTKASKSTAHVSRNAAWFNIVVVEKNKPENATAMITAADEMTVPVRAAASTHGVGPTIAPRSGTRGPSLGRRCHNPNPTRRRS